MKNKYLVVGGAGFIGSHLCDALVEGGNSVVVLDNFCSGRRENLQGIIKDVRLIDGDIREIAQLADEIGEVDIVVHLAALISGHDSLHDPASYLDVNVGGMAELIGYVAASKVRRIVFASSSTVYGDNTAAAIGEAAAPAPLTTYALTKLAGEHLLSIYGRLHGFSHVSLRLFNVYGPRQAVDHPYANVTCKFSHAAANGLAATRYGDGLQTRDFIYIDDVVRAFMAVLEDSRQPVYNVGTGKSHSINDLLAMLGDITGRPLAVEQRDAWPNDIRRIRASIERLEHEFGFSPDVTMRQGLTSTVEFFSGRSGGRA